MINIQVEAKDIKDVIRVINTHEDLIRYLEISTTTLETVYTKDKNNIAAKVCIENNKRILKLAKGE